MAVEEMPTAVDLFCGAGGMSLGLKRAGFNVVLAADNWKPAVESYTANFSSERMCNEDLSSISPISLAKYGIQPGNIDLIAGGPPCQGFSIQRIGLDADPRNHLVLRFGEFVEWLKPKMFLMENVPGLLGKRGHKLAAVFEERMRAAGYGVVFRIIDAVDYGVPQRRRRVVFAGWRTEDGLGSFDIPKPTLQLNAYRTVRTAIGDLPSPPSDYSSSPGDPLHRRMKISELNQERLRHIPPGGGFENLPVELRVTCHKNGADRIGHRYVYGRLHPDEPAATITARFDSFTRGKFAHPFEDRNISLREGARLQSFPDSFKFVGTQEEIAALIGNAIPPLLAEVLGRACLTHLMKTNIPAAKERQFSHTPLFVLGDKEVPDDAR